MDQLEQLTAYGPVNNQQYLSLLNARPRSIPFQNTGTPTASGDTQSAIVTIAECPFILNQLQLGSISSSGISAIPQSFYMSFNVYDEDNLGLFGGTNPRASTVFGSPAQVPDLLDPVKVFAPRTRLKLEWTNNNPNVLFPLGFELFLNGIEVLGMETKRDGSYWSQNEIGDALEEMMERRVR